MALITRRNCPHAPTSNDGGRDRRLRHLELGRDTEYRSITEPLQGAMKSSSHRLRRVIERRALQADMNGCSLFSKCWRDLPMRFWPGPRKLFESWVGRKPSGVQLSAGR